VNWLVDLFAHFRFQYFWAGLILLLFAGLARSRMALGLSLGAVVVNLVFLWPLWFGSGPFDSEDPLKILIFNVNATNRSYDEVLDTVRDSEAHIVVILEVDSEWALALSELQPEYDASFEARHDKFGSALLWRIPLEDHGFVELARVGFPSPEATFRWHDQQIHLLGVHTFPPVGGAATRLRDDQLAFAASWAQEQTGHVIVAGDFNTTPFSHSFGKLLEEGGLLNSQVGFGVQASWPAVPSPFGIPIDHLVHSEGLATVSRHLGQFSGSDHRSLLVELAVEQ